MKSMHRLLLAATMAGLCGRRAKLAAQTLIEEWGTAQFPPPPTLKARQDRTKDTAVLVMDFTKQTCTPERRKRCSDQVPKGGNFVTEARARAR